MYKNANMASAATDQDEFQYSMVDMMRMTINFLTHGSRMMFLFFLPFISQGILPSFEQKAQKQMLNWDEESEQNDRI